MKFYLGSHHPHWLGLVDVPLFVSHRRLTGRKTLPRAACDWALDSGGFSELSLFDEWRTTPGQYVAAVRRYTMEIGRLQWAAPQDWMCEPFMIAKTGLSVAEHQRRTVDNYLTLRTLAPDLPFVPVLQGWQMRDYDACVDLYARAGVDVTAATVVGLGSVCRRQATAEIGHITRTLHSYGLKLHGFGVKALGLHLYGRYLTSSDSLAWSYAARRQSPLPGCTAHINCANCLRFALRWRTELLAPPPRDPFQGDLFEAVGE